MRSGEGVAGLSVKRQLPIEDMRRGVSRTGHGLSCGAGKRGWSSSVFVGRCRRNRPYFSSAMAIIICPCWCLCASCCRRCLPAVPPPVHKPPPPGIQLEALPCHEYEPKTPAGKLGDEDCSICLAALEHGDLVRSCAVTRSIERTPAPPTHEWLPPPSHTLHVRLLRLPPTASTLQTCVPPALHR